MALVSTGQDQVNTPIDISGRDVYTAFKESGEAHGSFDLLKETEARGLKLPRMAPPCYNAGRLRFRTTIDFFLVHFHLTSSSLMSILSLKRRRELIANSIRLRILKLDRSRYFKQGAIVEGVLLDTALIARAAADIASDKKASDVLLLDIREVTTIADYFVICSGSNPRQLQAIADALEENLEKQGARMLHREGVADTGWILLDFGDVIVHIFGPKEREYYRLESLWSEAKTVVYLQ